VLLHSFESYFCQNAIPELWRDFS